MKLPCSTGLLAVLLRANVTAAMAAEFKVLVVMSYETNNP